MFRLPEIHYAPIVEGDTHVKVIIVMEDDDRKIYRQDYLMNLNASPGQWARTMFEGFHFLRYAASARVATHKEGAPFFQPIRDTRLHGYEPGWGLNSDSFFE